MFKDILHYWELSKAFHGHSCPGLALGCRIAFDAANLLGLEERCEDEEIVCIAETDACGIDAIQVVLGCTIGKGNLLLKPRGKRAFIFYKRSAGSDGIRIYWNPHDTGEMSREERIQHFLSGDAQKLYNVQSVNGTEPPQNARISPSLMCKKCGESASEPMVRFQDGDPYCLDCFVNPSRILR